MTSQEKIQQVLTLLENRKIVVFDTNAGNLDRFTVAHNKHYQANGATYGIYVGCSANSGFYQHAEFTDFRQFIKDLSSNKEFKRLTSTTDFTQVFSSGTLLNFYDSFIA